MALLNAHQTSRYHEGTMPAVPAIVRRLSSGHGPARDPHLLWGCPDMGRACARQRGGGVVIFVRSEVHGDWAPGMDRRGL